MKSRLQITALYIICLLLLNSCTYKNKNSESQSSTETTKRKTIVIQPFIDIPTQLSDSLYAQIKRINPNTVLEKPIEIPQSAYNKERNRYRADSLINYLHKRSTKNSVVIGLTTKDISTTKGKIQDWGVMGLAYCPGHSCVVSTYRLSKSNLNTQFFKIAIHELGHTTGLLHCDKDEKCFMRDAKGGNPFDELTDFCWFCKPHLRKNGWVLN